MEKLYSFVFFLALTSCAQPTFSLQGSSSLDKGALGSCDGHQHGAVIHGFTSKSAPCIEAARTCVNGHWLGVEIYPVCK